MKKSTLPISLCHASCPKCKLLTEFKMFESGAGGDLETYIGTKSGAIYRLDLTKLSYQKESRENFLKKALQLEESLRCIPLEIQCNICENVFSASSVVVDCELMVEAYEL